ncbi:MAG TPA: argininosuccinate synthase [Bacteroidota bacterium]|jgi:argininosuccinate synthase|nr:argininosuccinate synthase [Bacteroidota bacterium]
MKKQKIVVAYSGGLDTSVMVRWLMKKYNAEIVTATGNLGQKKELTGLREKAIKTGVSKIYIQDLTGEFVSDYIFPSLKAGALYENVYPMATSLGRPLLAKMLADVARKEGATMVAHGCTGKGNDQVRFEVSIAALAPELKVLAPLREWEFKSREEEIAYAKKHGIPVAATKKSPYSIDENIWGTSIECGVLEDPMVEPPADAYQRTTSPQDAPNKPEYVSIEFEHGIPVTLNGKKLGSVDLIHKLNEIAGSHGVGRMDLVENRLVGIKSREIYEAPAAIVLHFAHSELERLTLDKAVFHMKTQLSHEYANLIYNGLWFSPLKKALDAFVDETQKTVTGKVTVKLFKGAVTIAARTSPNSLYNAKLATYTSEDQFDHRASEGFIKIFGLPMKTFHQVQQRSANGKAKKPVRAINVQ